MGLFDVFRSKRVASRRAADLSTPLAVAREIERLIEANEYSTALEVAVKGVYENPRSEVVNAAYRFLRRAALGEDVVARKRAVDRAPDAIKYARLAEAYMEVGDYDKALETCHQAIEIYPEHEGPWIILARIRLERFKEDWIARDAELAVEYYEKAFDLNRNSYRTLIDLAELYCELGVKQRAIRKCEAILYFAPDDEKALQVLRKAESLPDRRREDVGERISAYADKKRRAMHRRSRRPGDPHGPSGRYLKEPALLQEKLESLGDILEGVREAVGVSLEGDVLASVGADGANEDGLGAAAQEIFEAANRCSLLMDIGHFKRGVFEGPEGSVYLVEFDQLRLAVISEPGVRLARLEEGMTRFVEDDLYR